VLVPERMLQRNPEELANVGNSQETGCIVFAHHSPRLTLLLVRGSRQISAACVSGWGGTHGS
jgi:hypothetical protein